MATGVMDGLAGRRGPRPAGQGAAKSYLHCNIRSSPAPKLLLRRNFHQDRGTSGEAGRTSSSELNAPASTCRRGRRLPAGACCIAHIMADPANAEDPPDDSECNGRDEPEAPAGSCDTTDPGEEAPDEEAPPANEYFGQEYVGSFSFNATTAHEAWQEQKRASRTKQSPLKGAMQTMKHASGQMTKARLPTRAKKHRFARLSGDGMPTEPQTSTVDDDEDLQVTWREPKHFYSNNRLPLLLVLIFGAGVGGMFSVLLNNRLPAELLVPPSAPPTSPTPSLPPSAPPKAPSPMAPPPSPPETPPPLVPPPPSSPPPPPTIANRLNEQYWNGVPSNDLDSAGVVMKVFDPCNDYAQPWLRATIGSPDIHCPDRMSVTIIRREWPKICTCMSRDARTPGFVFSSAIGSRISCAYRADTATTRDWRQCNEIGGNGNNGDSTHDIVWGCVPGCHGLPLCDSAEKDNGECVYEPSRLETMMQAQDLKGDTRFLADYNEVVLDTYNQPWTDLHPSVVVAVFYQARCSAHELRRAFDVRDQYCEAFGLAARCVPVLEYDELRESAPFETPIMPPLPPPFPPTPPLPPSLPPNCQIWCDDLGKPWDIKCGFVRCAGCMQCGSDSD